jgi:hypothetical protein
VSRMSFTAVAIIIVIAACDATPRERMNIFVAPSGADGNSGVISQPLLSVQSAMNRAMPGDSIILLPGQYNESIRTKRDGVSGQPIVVHGRSGAVFGAMIEIEHAHIIISGLEITGPQIRTAIRMTADADSCIITGNSIHDLAIGSRYIDIKRNDEGPQHPRGIVIRGNHFYGETMANIYVTMWGTGHLAEKNEIGPGVIREDAFRPFGDNHVIRANYIHDVKSGGGHTDVFQIFNDNGWRVRNLVFEQNHVENWDGQAWMADVTPDSYGIIVRNNLYINVKAAGNSYCPQTQVYFNTFIRCGWGNCQAIRMRSENGRGAATDSRVVNNIFYECGCGNNKGWYGVEEDIRDSFYANHNLVFPGKTAFSESNGFNGVDPLFVGAADFRLQRSSPAINAAEEIPGIQQDLINNARDVHPDLGAYEYREN